MQSQSPLQIALRMAAKREYSAFMLEKKLREKKIPPQDIQDALTFLKSKNFINDERFAELFTRSRLERGYGPLKIKYELQQRGISETILDQLEITSETLVETLQKLFQKKFLETDLSDPLQKRRVFNFFLARGFPQAIITDFFS